uniref:Uncharacterized protein AlNc14C409G11441 n=1 Tax=Albugo laibachii Nc14 TaxID=890382 RepID=F0WZ33_9STRA|nr:conserved hypothetical protein [Albugo laibachii Nc14]|eukprot:CCA26748.1 conserved hypothetical protein [Albugo laibachii Nc14]
MTRYCVSRKASHGLSFLTPIWWSNRQICVASRRYSVAKPAVLCLYSEFQLEEQGMQALEYLSSGSAVLLPRPAPSDAWRLLTCQHIVCPWRFPRYFSEKWDWLQFVEPQHVQYRVVLMDPHARVLYEGRLDPLVYLHPLRDVAMLSISGLSDCVSLTKAMERNAMKPVVFDSDSLKPGAEVKVYGYEAEASAFVPRCVSGRYTGQNGHKQAFAWTQNAVREGMCGGAVLNQMGRAVGVIEGIVPKQRDGDVFNAVTQNLAEHVAMIPADVIKFFLRKQRTSQSDLEAVVTGTALASSCQ